MARSATAKKVEEALRSSGKTQRQIADAMGLPRANVLSMIKNGETRLPFERIPALAAATGTDAVELLRTAMLEYQPVLWEILDSHLELGLSEDEQVFLAAYRQARQHSGAVICSHDNELLEECLHRFLSSKH